MSSDGRCGSCPVSGLRSPDRNAASCTMRDGRRRDRGAGPPSRGEARSGADARGSRARSASREASSACSLPSGSVSISWWARPRTSAGGLELRRARREGAPGSPFPPREGDDAGAGAGARGPDQGAAGAPARHRPDASRRQGCPRSWLEHQAAMLGGKRVDGRFDAAERARFPGGRETAAR